MQKNSTYFSLRGWSGVLIGSYGLLVVYTIYLLTGTYGDGFDGSSQFPIALLEILIEVLVIVSIVISLLTLLLRAKRRAKTQKEKLWSVISKKLGIQTLIPILLFTAVLLIIANNGYYSMITPLILFFYGIIILNLSRFSIGGLQYLGLAEITLSVMAYFIYDKEILFLVLGFGLFQILYGVFSINNNKKATLN